MIETEAHIDWVCCSLIQYSDRWCLDLLILDDSDNQVYQFNSVSGSQCIGYETKTIKDPETLMVPGCEQRVFSLIQNHN